MKTNNSKQLLIETLSAYLDGQLSEREMESMRQRLESDAALRNQLDDLRQTRYVLRHTPKLKRRRNFVLSPDVVKQQKTFFQAMNVSRVISAAASLLLVIALGSQYLLGGGMNLAAAPMADSANYEMVEDAPAEEPMMAMEAQDDDMADEALEEPMVEPVEEMDGTITESAEDTADVGEVEAEEPATIFAEETPEETDNPAGGVQGTQMPGGGGGEPPADEGEPDQMEEIALPTATMEGDMRSLPTEKDVEELQDEALTPDSGDVDQFIPPEVIEGEVPQSGGWQITPLRILQGVLLVLAVAGGLAAAYFRKKVR